MPPGRHESRQRFHQRDTAALRGVLEQSRQHRLPRRHGQFVDGEGRQHVAVLRQHGAREVFDPGSRANAKGAIGGTRFLDGPRVAVDANDLDWRSGHGRPGRSRDACATPEIDERSTRLAVHLLACNVMHQHRVQWRIEQREGRTFARARQGGAFTDPLPPLDVRRRQRPQRPRDFGEPQIGQMAPFEVGQPGTEAGFEGHAPVWHTRRAVMPLRLLMIGCRVGFAVAVVVAIGIQLSIHVRLGFSVVNFFSYFTNLANLFAAAVLLMSGWRASTQTRPSVASDLARNLAVIYMTVVGIVFVTLLRHVDLGSLRPWVNVLAHYVMPVVVAVDWLIDRPRHGLNRTQLWLAPALPLVYLAYVLVRGAAIGWYPYPFLDPSAIGYGAVAVYALGILGVFLAAGWMVKARA